MTITLSALQKQRRDTAANWTAENPTLLAGEIGIESDTGKIKIGDGVTAWNSLSYRPWSQLSAYPIVNADVASNAAIAFSKLASLSSGNILVGSSGNVATSVAVTGDVTVSNAGVTAIGSGVIVNADVNASAAIAGTKISPDFGSQNVTTTGTVTGASLTPSSSTVPTNGVYLPAANTVGVATNGSERIRIDANGAIGLGGANYGTSGQVLTSAGSGAAPTWTTSSAGNTDKIEEGNTSAEVIDTGSDGRFVVTTEGSERLRVDSSGRLLVGTSSALGVSMLQVKGNSGAADSVGRITVASMLTADNYGYDETVGEINFTDSAGERFGSIGFSADIYTGASGDSPGIFQIKVSPDGSSTPVLYHQIRKDGTTEMFQNGSGTAYVCGTSAAAGTTNLLWLMRNSASSVYSGNQCWRVLTNGNTQNSNNSYAGLSDIKLKENIVDSNSQWSDIRSLQIRNYNFKAETGQQTHTQIGLIAQEVELISPGLVFESPDRDAEDNDLGTVTKSVNYSVLYMKAVKALQEAMERIEQLEAEMAEVKAQLS